MSPENNWEVWLWKCHWLFHLALPSPRSVLFPFFPYLKMRTFFRGCSLLWKSLWIMSLLTKSTLLIYSTIYMNFKCIMLVKNAWLCRHSSKARASKEKTNHWLPNEEERGKKYIQRACVCMLGGYPHCVVATWLSVCIKTHRNVHQKVIFTECQLYF